VVPSTWNASPKDGKGQHGAYEAALIGTPMADPKRPVEILRTIHSFDPCLACASHVIGPNGEACVNVIVVSNYADSRECCSVPADALRDQN